MWKTYATASTSVFGPVVNVGERSIAAAALRAAVVAAHLSRLPFGVLAFHSAGKSERRSTPRRATCASVSGGATVDSGTGVRLGVDAGIRLGAAALVAQAVST